MGIRGCSLGNGGLFGAVAIGAGGAGSTVAGLPADPTLHFSSRTFWASSRLVRSGFTWRATEAAVELVEVFADLPRFDWASLGRAPGRGWGCRTQPACHWSGVPC